jgi:hypothetical protein
MSITPEQRLTIAQEQLDRAFDLINELWTNKRLDLFFTKPEHTEEDLKLRQEIVSARIAILNASHQVEMLIINNTERVGN